MKVLHVIDSLVVREGGDVRASAELAESTARLGHRVVVWFVERGNEATFAPEGVVLCRHRLNPSNRYALSLTFLPSLWRQVARADVVHIHRLWRFTTLAAALCARLQNKPYIVQPHGSLHPWKLRHKSRRKWLYFRTVEWRVLIGAAAVHAESDEDRRDLLGLLPASARIFVSPCGAPVETYSSPAEGPCLAQLWPSMAGRTCILFLSRVDVNKGVDLLLAAFRRLVAERPEADLGLLVVGPNFNGTWETVQRRGLLDGIESKVCYAGMVSEHEKVAALRGCDIYVLPSLSENFGISVLEALLSGAPVVTTTATPWAELRERGAGVIVEPSVDGIAGGLRQLLDVPATERTVMGKRGQDYAMSRFDWKSIAGELVDVYRSLLPGPSAR